MAVNRPILDVDKPLSDQFKQIWDGVDEECQFNFPNEPPLWLDEDLYDRGIEFVSANLVGVGMSNGEALVSGLCIPSFFKALTFSGETNVKKNALYRYRDTGLHIFGKWYFSKPWVENSEAAKSFKIVNKMHSHTANKIRDIRDDFDTILESKYEDPGKQMHLDVLQNDLKKLRKAVGTMPNEYSYFVNNSLIFTQFDMFLVQSSFFGGPLLYPEWYGCARATDAEMEAFLHVWRVFGYYLGIDDKYNAAQFDVQTTRKLGFECLERVVKPCCLHIHQQSVFLAQKVFLVPSDYYVWLYRNYHMMGLELKELWKKFSWRQTYFYYARFCFGYYIYPIFGLKQMFNRMARRLIHAVVDRFKSKSQIE